MNRKKYLAKNTALFAINNIGTRLITFFLVPVYTAALTTNDFGVADLVSTVATVLVPILTLNIGEAVLRFSLDEDANLNEIMSVGILIAFVSSIISLLVIPVSWHISLISGYGVIISLYCIMSGVYAINVCYLRGQEQLSQYAVCNIIHIISTAIFNIILLLKLRMGLTGYFLSYILGYLVGIIYSIVAGDIVKTVKQFKWNVKLARKMISYSIVLVPTSFMWWIMNSSDRLMVTAIVGAAANGIYAVSYKIPTVLSTMSTVFNQAWSYSAIKEDKKEDREEFNNKMFSLFSCVQFVITAGLLLIIKPFMHIYVSESYYIAWKYIPYLLIGFLFMSFGTFLSTSYTVNKDSKGFLLSGMTGAILNIILNLLLIPLMGTSGAALATCISYFTVFLYRSIDTRKYIKIKLVTTRNIVSITLLIIMSIVLYIENKLSFAILSALFVALIAIHARTIIVFLKELLKLVAKNQ